MTTVICPEKARRLESLGDNCEIGFVFDEVGNTEGGFFRWARSPTESVLNTLKVRFAHCFEFENLSPSWDDMVCDDQNQIYYHSEMISHLIDGQRVFLASESERRAIYESEVQKRMAMVDKFYRRLRSGQLIFVIKNNDPVDPAVIDDIESELVAMAEGAQFQLLQMRVASDGELPGSLIKITDRRLEGTVAFFAQYHLSGDFDRESWLKVLGAALA